MSSTPPTPPVPTAAPREVDRRWADVRRLADLLDSRFRIPGTQQTFGVDALLGLVPGVGDVVGLAAGGVVVSSAVRLGARGWTLVHMLVNIALDATIGSVPIAGTVFDVVYKANNRNVALLEEHVQDARAASAHARRNVMRSMVAVALVILVLATLLVVGVVWLLRAIL